MLAIPVARVASTPAVTRHGDRKDPAGQISAAQDRPSSRTASIGCTLSCAPEAPYFGEYELREAPGRPPAAPLVYSSPFSNYIVKY